MALRRNRLRERLSERYGLRSLFFYHKLLDAEFPPLFRAVRSLDCSTLNFDDLTALEIAQEAAGILESRSIPICHVFCHPDVIKGDPKLVAYYRGAAAISQKGLQQLAGTNVRRFEMGANTRPLAEQRALEISRVLNKLISAAVIQIAGLDVELVQAQVFMTAGAQADGSWRQVPGKEASQAVKFIMMNDLLQRGQIEGAPSKDDIKSLREFNLANGYKIVFGSERDISIIEPDGLTEAAVVEIKGGTDTAGALERYGAAKKSFDDALSRNPRVITVYLAAVITATVAQRIAADRAVRETFNLTDILAEESEKERFLNQVYWWMHLSR
jgi:hypothetical protein